MESEVPVCCNPGCSSIGDHRYAKARGVCNNCYQMLRRMIQRGVIEDWSYAEDRGWCTPLQQPGYSRFLEPQGE